MSQSVSESLKVSQQIVAQNKSDVTVLGLELFHFNPYSGQAFAQNVSHKPFILIFLCGEAQSTGNLP